LSVIGYTHQIQAGDFTVVLDSLQELFQENPDAVTPKLLAARMETKIAETHSLYLCDLFVLGVGVYNHERNRFREKGHSLHHFDPELLAQKRALVA